MILNYYALKAQIQANADVAGLELEYGPEGTVPRTDGKRITVPTPRADFTDDELARWMRSVFHEIHHNMPKTRDCFDILKKYNINMKSMFGMVLNSLEDHRTDYLNDNVFYGKKAYTDRGALLQLQDLKDKYPVLPPEIQSLLQWDTDCRAEWVQTLQGFKFEGISTQGQEYYEQLQAYTPRLFGAETAEDIYQLTCDIFRDVFKQGPEEAKQSTVEEFGVPGGGVVKYSDILNHQHGETLQDSKYHIEKIIYDVEDSGYNPGDTEQLNFTGRYSQAVLQRLHDTEASSGFAEKVLHLLQSYKQTRYEYEQQRGRIHTASLYKVFTQPEPKVFKKPVVSRIMDTAVTVLMDHSGSMGSRDKYYHAGHSLLLLNDLANKINLNVELMGFSTTEDGVTPLHTVFRPFGQRTHQEEIKRRVAETENHMHNNADGASILWGYQRLAQQRNTRKVMIVLSDGSPACGHKGIYGFTKEVVKELEKHIDVYAIGILDNNVQNIYTRNRVIKNVHELEDALLEVIRDKVIN